MPGLGIGLKLDAALGGGGGSSDPIAALAPIGLWYMDEYQTTPRNAVRNRAVATVPSANLLSAPRRLFNNGSFYLPNNVTISDNAAVGSDGLTQASTVVWGSADAYIQMTGMTLPVGSYLLALDVRTTDGSTVSFRMGPNAAMQTKSATPAWQPFTCPITVSGSPSDPNVLIIRSVDSATPANLAICDARIFSGGVDLGADVLAGHMYFGHNNYDSGQPSFSGGVITLNASGKWGTVQLPIPKVLTAFTAVAVGQRKAVPGGQLQAYISKVQSYTDFSALHDNAASSPATQYNGNSAINLAEGLFDYKTNDWHTITTRYSTPNYSVWMEDMKFAVGSTASETATIADMWVGVALNTGIFSKYALSAIALFDKALTDAEVRTVAAALKARAALSGLTVGNSKFLAAEGDSITFGTGGTNGGYANLFGPNSSPTVNGRVFAIAGSTLANVVSRLTADAAMLPASKAGRLYIYSLLIGRNDLLGYPGGTAAYAAAVSAHMANVKAAGFDRTVLMTVLPSTVPGFNAERNALNAIYTGVGWSASNNVDVVCDTASDITMGPDAAASNVLLYGDGTHPTNLGYTTLETVYRPAINGIV